MRLAVAFLLVLIAVPVSAQALDADPPGVGAVTGPSRDVASLALSAAYAATVGADIGSSVACGARGTCREGNPLYGSSRGWQFGAARAAIGAGTLYVAHRWTKPRTWQRYVALGGLVAMQAAVVTWNVRQGR